MNKDLVKKIDDSFTKAQKESVKSNVALQFKALIFLNRKVCRSCRFKILNRLRNGSVFNPSLLCTRCKEIYEHEVV